MTELKTKLKANAFDSMFNPSNEKVIEPENESNSNPSNDGLESIKIDLLKAFFNHTFKIYEGERLQSLSDSIKENGVISPILVRPSENDEYEIISGHNRVEACKLAGITEIPAIIKELTDEEATVIMVDSNLEQREEILPSEKAFSYKAKLDALKSQGKRTDLSLCQDGTKHDSGKIVAENCNESRRDVYRYIRLTNLEIPLLDQVDKEKIKFTQAVNLSFLRPKEQQYLIEILEREEDFSVSNIQSTKLKEMSKIRELNFDDIDKVITDEVSNKVSDFKIPYKRVQNYFPKTVTPKIVNDTIDKALAFYFEHHQQQDELAIDNETEFDMAQ